MLPWLASSLWPAVPVGVAPVYLALSLPLVYSLAKIISNWGRLSRRAACARYTWLRKWWLVCGAGEYAFYGGVPMRDSRL